MIEIHSNNSFTHFSNQNIAKVKSILITTDVGDILLTPCKDTIVSLTTTETVVLFDGLTEKEATIEAKYDNMVIIK